MKLRSLLLGLLAFVFFACPDKDDEIPQGSLNVEATIDGQAWKASGNSRITTVGGFTVFAIGAGATDRSNIALTLDAERTGNFDLAGKAIWTTANQLVYSASSGTLTISSIEGDKVSGTFAFKASPMTGTGPEVTIANGKFTNINIMR
ncbi:MAG: DUF6252 family protein [Bacteroidota bacterium]|uniref:Lipocalin-like domain-containing protein n=1 Tax=Algoriphagus faecimaris TaxID=686796 RepID=A0A1G6TZ65_9BACT|nr:DUF6252 family protein [Algoriphagus faecimaris]SDD34224.1 hypothetical protein SAMN04488104_102521 [Algoriphagus faecimaris]